MPRVLGVCLAALGAVLIAVAAADAGDGMFDRFDRGPARAPPSAGCCRPRWRPPATTPGRSTATGAPGSQAALEAWSAREFGGAAENAAAAALVLGFLDEVALAAGTSGRSTATASRSRCRSQLLGPPEAEEGGERRWSRAGALTVLTHRFDADETRAWHDAAARADAGAGTGRPPPRGRAHGHRRARCATAAASSPARTAPPTAGRPSTSPAAPDEAGAMNLAAASIRPGPPLPWDLPADGRLTAARRGGRGLRRSARARAALRCRRSTPARCRRSRPGPAAPAPASTSARARSSPPRTSSRAATASRSPTAARSTSSPPIPSSMSRCSRRRGRRRPGSASPTARRRASASGCTPPASPTTRSPAPRCT